MLRNRNCPLDRKPMKMSFDEISKRNNIPDGRFYHPANIFLSRQLFILFYPAFRFILAQENFSPFEQFFFARPFLFFYFYFFTLLLRSISTSCYPSCQKYVSRFEEINYDMTHFEEGETTRMIFNRKGNSLDGSLNNFKLRRKLK